MFDLKGLTRNVVLAGVAFGLFGPSAFAQYGSYPRTYARGEWGYANRVVAGTVVAVANLRYGQRIRLADGMDLVAPESALTSMRGRRSSSVLVPGDVVRMAVYSRQGDGRDARVISIELLQSNAYRRNGHRLTGTVIGVDRRERIMTVATDRGDRIQVDLNECAARDWSAIDRFRRGDRVAISGRMDRGIIVATDIRRFDGRDDDDRWNRY